MYSKVFIVVSSLLFCTVLYSQTKYSEGQVTMEVTDLELNTELELDTTVLNEKLNDLRTELHIEYFFKEDQQACKTNTPGLMGFDTTRIVYDMKSNIQYTFMKSGYLKDTLIIPEITPELQAERESVILSSRELKEERFGLSLIEYTCLIQQDTAILTITNDIARQPLLPSDGFNFIAKGVLVSVELNLGIARMKYEMTSFSPLIDDTSVFSTDISQVLNIEEAARPFIGSDDNSPSEDQMVAELDEEYGEYVPKGRNNDILIKMNEDGFVTKEQLNYVLQEKKDLDIPNIIGELQSVYNSEYVYMSKRKPHLIVSDFEQWGILSPSISVILSDTAYWHSLEDYKRLRVLQYAAMLDRYKTKEARRLIVDNAKSIRFVTDADETINDDFVNGNIGIDEWYAQYDSHFALLEAKSKSDDELIGIVKSMFDFSFDGLDVVVNIEMKDEAIVIESQGIQHRLLLDELYEINYDKPYNEEKQRYEHYDYIEYNESFYRKIVDKIKQVASDNGLRQAYMIYTTKPFRPYTSDEYEYAALVERFPSLAYYERKLYLKKLVKKVYDPFASLNMSFPYHPDMDISTAYTFGPGHLVDVAFDVEYVSTKSKLKFISFLRENSHVYNLNTESLQGDSLMIMSSLMEGSENLSQYLGPVKITASKIYDVTPKSDYRKSFDNGNDGLESAYYSLAKILGDDFDIKEFKYNQSEHKEYFKLEGVEYSIDPGVGNMIKFLGKHTDKSKSGKKFYMENVWSVTESVFYYLHPDHVNFLKNNLNLPI